MMFVLNRDFKILASASNESRNTLHYYDDKIHSELKSGVSTFSFTVSKAQEDSKHIQEGNFVTLVNSKGKQLLFTIMEIEEDSTQKQVYCEDIGLDLLNETKGPTKAEAQPIAYYFSEALHDSGWEIGVNEVAHLTRSLEYTSFANSLERLLSICNSFDGAELDFTVDFDGNTIAHQYVNIYKRRGKDTGIRLNAGIDLVNARRTISLDTLATALYGVGAEIQTGDENAVKQYVDFRSITYDDGRFYQWNGYILDRESNKRWSRYRKESATKGFIVDYYSYDTDSPQELFNRTLSQLKKRCEPAVTYEVEIVELDKDLSIGDTITVVDSEFNPPLYLSARVLTIDESETTPEMNKLTLGNYVLLKPSIDEQLIELQKTLEESRKSWSSQNQPVLSVESTNGEAFFDDNVNTILQAKILRGGIVITSSYADGAFIWTKKDRLGNTVAGWSRTGKNLPISYTDVLDKATFICTVAGMQAQTTLFNTLTTVRKTTAPSNPQPGQQWIDTSVTPSVHKIYLSGEWKLVTPVSGEEFTEVKELANTNMQGIVAVNTEVGKKVDTITYTSKVSAIESALANKLEIAVANATKVAQDAEIAKKVAQTTYNTKVSELGSAISGHTTRIEATETGLLAKASTTEVNALKTRMNTAETSLTTNATEIALKAAKTDLDAVEGRLDTAESTLTVQAGQIASKVNQTDFNAVNTRLGTAESTITQQATQIASKVATTTYNSGIAAKEDSIVKATTAPAHASGKLWLNTSVTPNVLNRSTGTAWVKVTPTTAAEVGAYSSSEGSSLAGRVTTAESTIVQQGNSIALKASQTDLNAIDGRLDTAEASLVVQAGQISTKVESTTYNTKMGALDTAIGTKANASDVSALTTRVTTAESNITQNANGIALRATKTEAQTYATNAQNAAINSAATDATSKANAALDNAKTYADGINLALGARVTSAESAITADAITNTVMGTTTFNAKLAEYATGEELAGYTTIDEFTSIKNMAEETRNQVINLDFTPYVKTTQVEQLEDAVNTRISQSGGVNILRNSIGWNGTDFWVPTSGAYTVQTIQNPELEAMGFGAGWYSPIGTYSHHGQELTLPTLGVYTLSFYMKKSAYNASDTLKHAGVDVVVDGITVLTGLDGAGQAATLTNGFELFSYTFEAKTSKNIMVRLSITDSSETTISGLMLNLGSQPLQWTSHSTEVYNTNVRMDTNGIQVMGNRDGSRTVITPDEFSGYEDGEKIFTLNGKTTEVKQLKAEKQFEMAPITIVTIDNGTYKGWAFI